MPVSVQGGIDMARAGAKTAPIIIAFVVGIVAGLIGSMVPAIHDGLDGLKATLSQGGS